MSFCSTVSRWFLHAENAVAFLNMHLLHSNNKRECLLGALIGHSVHIIVLASPPVLHHFCWGNPEKVKDNLRIADCGTLLKTVVHVDPRANRKLRF